MHIDTFLRLLLHLLGTSFLAYSNYSLVNDNNCKEEMPQQFKSSNLNAQSL